MSLRHALLGLLANRSASGYDLLKSFETSLANAWPATQSQVYGELGKLSAEGLLDVTAEGPRGRKEYSITESGRAELRHWLVEVEPERVRRSSMLLRVFFLDTLAPEEARTYLTAQAEVAAERNAGLRALEANVPWDGSPLSVYGRVALEYGLRLSQMQRDWAEWAAEQVTPPTT
ncbi:PadR family transcriptional regulator [Embleya scabrispora]|uniref:PadR family transcriptional regulator n=1 Tax=Embleya scabrispora TaxID=159449 RepID=A0A1T3NZ41_9ACTN|nr:PadR family transcriptional regulator [Embleya scabrispora]OPC81941.1 PadR family transcriptional regulator [Embleya scabrispora]